MAVTVAQTPIQYDDATASTTHQNTGVTTTAGNRLVLAIMDRGPTDGPTGITDSASNTWTQIARADDGSTLAGASIWTTSNNASAISAGSYTITTGGALGIQSTLFELAGTNTGTDVNHTGTGSSTSISSGSSGTAAAGNCIAIGIGGDGFIFADASFTSVAFTTAGGTFQTRTTRSGFIQCATGYVILSGGSTTAQTFSLTGPSNGWASVIALFPPVAVAGPQTLNNYQFVKAPDGISVTEKIK